MIRFMSSMIELSEEVDMTYSSSETFEKNVRNYYLGIVKKFQNIRISHF